MKLVIDANVVISALIADSKTRELIVTVEPDLLTPAFVHDEIENYENLIVEKSGIEPDRVAQFIDLLFQYIEVIPASEFYPAIERADEAIGDTDPDDVLYSELRIEIDELDVNIVQVFLVDLHPLPDEICRDSLSDASLTHEKDILRARSLDDRFQCVLVLVQLFFPLKELVRGVIVSENFLVDEDVVLGCELF